VGRALRVWEPGLLSTNPDQRMHPDAGLAFRRQEWNSPPPGAHLRRPCTGAVGDRPGANRPLINCRGGFGQIRSRFAAEVVPFWETSGTVLHSDPLRNSSRVDGPKAARMSSGGLRGAGPWLRRRGRRCRGAAPPAGVDRPRPTLVWGRPEGSADNPAVLTARRIPGALVTNRLPAAVATRDGRHARRVDLLQLQPRAIAGPGRLRRRGPPILPNPGAVSATARRAFCKGEDRRSRRGVRVCATMTLALGKSAQHGLLEPHLRWGAGGGLIRSICPGV